MPYFYSEIDDWTKPRRWAWLWSVTSSQRQFHRKFLFTRTKKSVVTARNLQSIKTFLILELSQYRKSGSTFSSSKHIVAGSDCSRLWNVLCLCSPNLPKPCRSSATRDWQLILQSKPTIVFCDSLRGDCQMTCRGSNFDSNLNSAARPTKCEGLSAQKSLKKLCGVWILVESVKDALFLCLSCAEAQPLELGRWFYIQNLRLSSVTALTSTGLNCDFDLNLNSTAWPKICKGLSALKPETAEKLETASSLNFF